jgi:hypothetical protein
LGPDDEEVQVGWSSNVRRRNVWGQIYTTGVANNFLTNIQLQSCTLFIFFQQKQATFDKYLGTEQPSGAFPGLGALPRGGRGVEQGA